MNTLTDRIKKTMTGMFGSQKSIPMSQSASTAAAPRDATTPSGNFFKFQQLRNRTTSSEALTGGDAPSKFASGTNTQQEVDDPSTNARPPILGRGISKSNPTETSVERTTVSSMSVSVKAMQSWMGSMVGSSKSSAPVSGPANLLEGAATPSIEGSHHLPDTSKLQQEKEAFDNLVMLQEADEEEVQGMSPVKPLTLIPQPSEYSESDLGFTGNAFHTPSTSSAGDETISGIPGMFTDL